MTLTAHPPPKRSRLHRALELVPAPELVVLGAVAAAAVLLSLLTGGHHASAAADVLRGTLAALLLFGVCGEAITRLLIPRRWGPLRLGFIAPLGAITSGFVLLWWGVLRVPLQVSLWLTLALGILASVLVRRRERTRSPAAVGEPLISRKVAAAWTAILVILFLVAMLPAWRTGAATIYGQNPDAHQVTGVAVLFQHDPPTAVDPRLPIDVMPPAWRFRYPIFYPLAAASNLAHLDPIAVFPSLSALLLVIAAFGFGAFALLALRAPPAAAAAASAAVGFSVINLHLAWHPYWNQLWCLAMLPLTLLAAFWAVEQGGRNAWATLALSMLMLPWRIPSRCRTRSWSCWR